MNKNNNTEETNPPGYPPYPENEDIYAKLDKVSTEQDDSTYSKEPRELDFSLDRMEDDLDVPGSELDDEQEAIGSEDEENNYYSLGGDDHNDLDEDNGE